ncbi:MAG: phosphoribosylanthranilate isomerase [Saprospiraceae bacterium]|jgi:phosphoribosylanthranilate isomerase
MIVKVCGIKEVENYNAILNLGVDMVGVNFYKPSSRYINDALLPAKKNEIRIGVYVKANMDELRQTIDQYDIDVLQLHGDESIEYCQEAQKLRPIIKVWRIDPSFDWQSMAGFEFADAFLFDTKTDAYGGSGDKFDWGFLSNYKMNVPFLLSGGIGPEDSADINTIDHPMFKGVDINSRFELEPGIKNGDAVALFINKLRN